MMKKIFCVAFSVLFFLSCALFAVGAFSGETDSTNEGRELAAFPAVRGEDGTLNTAFFTEFDAWLTDRFTGRSALITVDAWIKENVFRTGSDQVIVGRDGFLFYADTAADFTGENALTDAELTEIVFALQTLSDYAAAHGAQLIVAIAPNKNTVYPDQMPALYRKSDALSNRERLHSALTEAGIAYADLAAALTAESGDTLLYHKRDTHWNNAGALVAANAILDAAHIAHDDLSTYPLLKTHDFFGDLDELLYPSLARLDDNFTPDFDFSSAFIYTSTYRTAMDMVITTRGSGTGRALVFRDSFGSALIPYLSTAFSEVRYERAAPYRIDLLKQFDADIVILEIAERNISTLVSAAARLTEADGAS